MNLEQLVRQYVQLPSNANGSGWYSIRCQVCNDHKHKKRGGWKFDKGSVIYNCFNCDTHAIFNPDVGFISDEMKNIVKAYQIPDEEIQKFSIQNLKLNKRLKRTTTKSVAINVKPIILPSHFYLLMADSNDIWAKIAREYLATRSMTVYDHPFYLSSDRVWKGRLIIPIYRNGHLIFYQGRDMTDRTNRVKYLSAPEQKQTVFYGYDQIEKQSDQPLYITEGFFDAFHIEGASILGNKLSQAQVEILQQSKRPKVVIPDRMGDGDRVAFPAIDLGWGVSFPDIGACKDINAAIVKYGTLYVAKSISDNVVYHTAAKARTRIMCKHSTKQKQK